MGRHDDAATARARRSRRAAERRTSSSRTLARTSRPAAPHASNLGTRRVGSARRRAAGGGHTAVTDPVAGLDCRSVGLTRAQLLTWAITVATTHPHQPMADALTDTLGALWAQARSYRRQTVPEPPATPVDVDTASLTQRIGRALHRRTARIPPAAPIRNR